VSVRHGCPSCIYKIWEMDLNTWFNQSHSSVQCRSGWPNWCLDVFHYIWWLYSHVKYLWSIISGSWEMQLNNLTKRTTHTDVQTDKGKSIYTFHIRGRGITKMVKIKDIIFQWNALSDLFFGKICIDFISKTVHNLFASKRS
jgi:hypothetical protein